MLLSLLPFLGVAVCLGIAFSVVRRHWSEIRLLDPDSVKEERQRRKRMEMIHRRFDRIRAEQLLPFRRLGRAIGLGATAFQKRLQERVHAFESTYRSVKNPFSAIAPTTRERIKTLLSDGRSLARDLKFADAERRYLEILSLDTRHVDAYKGLGMIYLKQKLYPQARETFEFLLKLNKTDDAIYAGLAEISEAEGDLLKAEAHREKAVELGLRQPQRHAELAEFLLRQNRPVEALVPAEEAVTREPESARYIELALETALSAKNAKRARHWYDRYRLMTEDQQRFQAFREKVEKLEQAEKNPKKR
jgi:tetratricopeptide (TPR) repeat protein